MYLDEVLMTQLENLLTVRLDNETETIWEIENNPFLIQRYEDKFSVLLGNYRICEYKDSIEDAYKDSLRTDWTRIIQVIEVINNLKKEEI